jgi:peptide maturation system protein (TIGR04066 family)
MRIAIYPFIEECMIFSDFKDILSEEYVLSEAASPRSWGYFERDIETIDGIEKIKKSPKEFCKENDILIIPDISLEPIAEKGIIKEIVNYIPSVKKVFCCAEFTDEHFSEVENVCKDAGIEFINTKDHSQAKNDILKYGYTNKKYAFINTNEFFRSFKEVAECDVPVVAVSGEWESTDKFPIQLKLLRSLRKNGYKVSMIGSSVYSCFFGVETIPDFMFCGEIGEFEKPHLFSRYVKGIAYSQQPDIMIIGVPGAAQPYNSYETNRFGVLPYLIFQGIVPDYYIFTTIYRENSNELMHDLSNMCKYRYGIKPDTMHISNLLLENNTTYEISVDESFVNRDKVDNVINSEYADAGCHIMNVMGTGNDDIIVENLINKLSYDSTAVVK